MANYRKVADLPLTDAAYIAGLIDGEGTITLSRRHANENRQLVVSISNNEKPLLDYVLTTIGAGKITNKRKSQSHHANSYNWSISKKAGFSLRVLFRFLGHLLTAEHDAFVQISLAGMATRLNLLGETLDDWI